jgi:hypothetical protein
MVPAESKVSTRGDADKGRFFLMPDDSPVCGGHVWHASVIEWWTKTSPQRRCYLVEIVHVDHGLLVADVCYLDERSTRDEAERDLARYQAPPFLYGDVIWRAFEPNDAGEPRS